MVKLVCYAIIFLAEAIIAWLYFEYLYIPKTGMAVRSITFGISYIALLLLFLVDNLLLNAIGMCVINAALSWVNYRCSIKASILHGAFLEFAIVGTELLTNLLIVGFGHDFSAYTVDISVLIAMAIVSKLLYLVVALIGARFFKPKKDPVEEPGMVVLFYCLPLFSIIIAVLIIHLGLSSEVTKASGIMMLCTMFSLMIVNLIFMILYNYLQRVHDDHLSLQLSIQKEQADVAYYQAMQEQFESQQILIHDIKNHLRTIDNMSKEGDNKAIAHYVSSLADSLSPLSQVRLCNDPILNMILLRCRDDCAEQKIDFQCDIRDNAVAFMDGPSITTLYSNLLSNAVEAAANSKEKSIEISVIYNLEQSIIIVSAINSCDNEPPSDNKGGFLTTKKDGNYHGVGLRSIRRVVNKYNGVSSVYYDEKNRLFHHIIQFPMPN